MKKPRQKQETTGLLVLGMHRSGTSALAGTLELLGVPSPGELLPPASDNPKGFFENKAVYQFHDRLLDYFGSRWDDPIPLSLSWLDTPAEAGFVSELTDIIAKELIAKTSIFAVKDPRMCRFLPLWRAAFTDLAITPRALISLRHPVPVAQSLAARNDFPRAKSLLLWLDHTLSAERQTRDLKRSIVVYDELLGDWRAAAGKISREIDIQWPKSRDRVEHAVDEFLSEQLRHHADSATIGDATKLEALVAKAWAAMLRLSENASDDDSMQVLDEVSAEFGEAIALLSPFLFWESQTLADAQSEVGRLTHVESKLTASLKWAEETRALHEAEIGTASEALAEAQSEIGRLTHLESKLTGSLQWAEETRALHLAEIDAFAEERQKHQATVSLLSGQVATSKTAMAELTGELRRTARQRESYDRQIVELGEAHERATADAHAHFQSEIAQALHRQSDAFDHERRALQDSLNRLRQEADTALANWQLTHQAVLALQASTSWRLTSPIRGVAERFPPSGKRYARRLVKTMWWLATPWKLPERVRFLRSRSQNAALAAQAALMAAGMSASAAVGPVPGEVSDARPAERAGVDQAADGQGSPRPTRLPAALRVFETGEGKARLSMITDSINEGSLFGGVATALIFSALLAKMTGRTLRIITRTQAPAAENVGVIFRAHGIPWQDNIEFEFANIGDPDAVVPIVRDEYFVTTSWWTTASARQVLDKSKILYILQEDERMFYPYGDELLMCEEILSDADIAKIINSKLLYEHLRKDKIIGDEAHYFEPSFPSKIYYKEKSSKSGKMNFFFYARPNNQRNLYDRGVDVIEAAIEQGILDPSRWNIMFVGKDLRPITLAGGFRPELVQNLIWDDYAKLVRSVDLGLTLMYTPHPSYPPLDIAASGGVAVTNRFGIKEDLSSYSKSIICVKSDAESLLDGLRQGVKAAADSEFRDRALRESGILRDWHESFDPVLAQLERIDGLWPAAASEAIAT